MLFQNSLLSTTDQTALAAAITAIPALLLPLSAQITAAQPFATQINNYKSQAAAIQAAAPYGGALPPTFSSFCDSANAAEQTAAPVTVALYNATQNCQVLALKLLPIAQRQAEAMVAAGTASFYLPSTNVYAANLAATPFVGGLATCFNAPFGMRDNSLLPVLAKAVTLQTLLQNIESGTDFFALP